MLDAISIDNCRLLIQTLGHSLWQASVVAVLCWLVLRSLPARKAGTRYAVTCGGLVVVVLATLLTAAAVSPAVPASMNIDSAAARPIDSTVNSPTPLSEQNSVTAAQPSDDHDQTKAASSDHSAELMETQEEGPALEAAGISGEYLRKPCTAPTGLP